MYPSHNQSTCTDGEVKTVPLKKGSIAITMLCKKDFKTPKCFKKMSRMLIIPYLRDGDTIQFTELILMEKGVFGELYDVLEADYNRIRKNYIETGILTSKTGDLLQNRTKGPGHVLSTAMYYEGDSIYKNFIGSGIWLFGVNCSPTRDDSYIIKGECFFYKWDVCVTHEHAYFFFFHVFT